MTDKSPPVVRKPLKRRRLLPPSPPPEEELVPPSVNSLDDLIDMAKTGRRYQNIQTELLWRILPQLLELQEMVGLEKIKQTLVIQIIFYLQNLHVSGVSTFLHTAIMGAPGTGKTTVARIIGEMYQNMEMLSSDGIFRVAKREDFIAEYLGQTAIKTRKLLESCLGGVLFIDEVYALGPGYKENDVFSKEAIDTLNAFLSEHPHDFCCIIAGYEDEMERCFFSVNAGLKRRFQWIHRMVPYRTAELAAIFFKMVVQMGWTCDVSMEDVIALIRQHKELFTYAAGDIENLATKCRMTHAKRIFSTYQPKRFVLTLDDLKQAITLLEKNKLEDPMKEYWNHMIA